MDISWAIFYGFIQGVTEFLPVSSSGHLALIPFFFKLQDPGVVFDLLMHLGTAIAVILYFRKDVMTLIREGLDLILKRDIENTRFFQNFMFATACSFALILLIKDLALGHGRNPAFIGINFIVFGIIMYISDRKLPATSVDLTKHEGLKKSALIGLSQALAVFPGVSRSGITLTSSRFLGLGRVEASRFSFLLSLPVIIGSIVFKLPKIVSGEAIAVEPLVMLIGVIASFLFGIVTIHFFLKLIAKIGLIHFAVYRVIIGLTLIGLQFSS